MPSPDNFARTRRRPLLQGLALCAAGALMKAPAMTLSPATPLVPAGHGTLKFLGLRIYEARLEVDADFRAEDYAAHPLALTLEYARGLEGQLIAERSLIEMRRIGPIEADSGQRWLAFMREAFPDVRAGDQICGRCDGRGRASFLYNGQPHGEIDDPAFTRLFFGIWLHPATSQPEMRRALLGRFA